MPLNRITLCPPSASVPGLPINEGPQRHERLHCNPRLLRNHHGTTDLLVEHPARDAEPHVFATLYDHGRFFMQSQPAKHPDFAPEERMKPVCDSRRTELMSSVVIP